MVTDDRLPLGPDSLVVAAGRSHEPGEPLNPPIVAVSTYGAGGLRGYARSEGTPTWEAFEEAVGTLCGGHAVAFSSGMAAISAVVDVIGPSAVALPDDLYHGVGALLRDLSDRSGLRVVEVAVADTAAWMAAAAEVDLVWLESPSNPLLEITDLPAVITAAREAGAAAVVDNTFATPLGQRPLELGADIEVHSATKFIGGHSDLLMGIAVAGDVAMAERLRARRTLTGAVPGALEAFLSLRGLRTLSIRRRRAQENAAHLAARLEGHPIVLSARYPGLASHPQHDRAVRLLRGAGSIITFDVGSARVADAAVTGSRLVRHATSLGGVESTWERRSGTEGQEHLPPGLIRLSVGIESAEDLWNDIERALALAAP